MPVVTVQFSGDISSEQEKTMALKLGKIIELISGKNESGLLIDFEENHRFWLAGNREHPVAHVRAAVLQRRDHQGYQSFTRALTQLVASTLHLLPQHVFITYEDIDAWGVGGYTLEG